jgi:hypothetical protein
MKRFGKVLAALAVVGALVGIGSAASAQKEDHKVAICHRTNAATNPYVFIEVDVHAVDGQPPGADHFGQHQGPLVQSVAEAQALKAQGIKWGDIIPPVEGFHGGLNWPEGQAILEAGCRFVDEKKEEEKKVDEEVVKEVEKEVEKVEVEEKVEREVVVEVQPEAAVPVRVQPQVTG